MTQRIILSIVSIAMLVFSLQNRDRKSILLTFGLTLPILISWTGIPVLMNMAFLFSVGMALLVAIFSMTNRDLTMLDKIGAVTIGIWSATLLFGSYMHWPYEGAMTVSTIIPLSLYLILLSKGLFNKNEFHYLTILASELFHRLLTFWE